jgi:hypothetical protein
MIETTEKAQHPAAQCILSSELTGEQIARRPHHSPKITDSSSSKPYCPRRRWPVRRPPSWLPPGAAFSGPRLAAPGSMSKARVYSDINVLRPKEYWDYEGLTVQWGSVPIRPRPFASRSMLCCHTHAVNRNCCLGSYCSNTEIIGQVSANLASHELGQAVRLPDVCCRSGQVS